jgi:hypothetical protein
MWADAATNRAPKDAISANFQGKIREALDAALERHNAAVKEKYAGDPKAIAEHTIAKLDGHYFPSYLKGAYILQVKNARGEIITTNHRGDSIKEIQSRIDAGLYNETLKAKGIDPTQVTMKPVVDNAYSEVTYPVEMVVNMTNKMKKHSKERNENIPNDLALPPHISGDIAREALYDYLHNITAATDKLLYEARVSDPFHDVAFRAGKSDDFDNFKNFSTILSGQLGGSLTNRGSITKAVGAPVASAWKAAAEAYTAITGHKISTNTQFNVPARLAQNAGKMFILLNVSTNWVNQYIQSMHSLATMDSPLHLALNDYGATPGFIEANMAKATFEMTNPSKQSKELLDFLYKSNLIDQSAGFARAENTGDTSMGNTSKRINWLLDGATEFGTKGDQFGRSVFALTMDNVLANKFPEMKAADRHAIVSRELRSALPDMGGTFRPDMGRRYFGRASPMVLSLSTFFSHYTSQYMNAMKQVGHGNPSALVRRTAKDLILAGAAGSIPLAMANAVVGIYNNLGGEKELPTDKIYRQFGSIARGLYGMGGYDVGKAVRSNITPPLGATASWLVKSAGVVPEGFKMLTEENPDPVHELEFLRSARNLVPSMLRNEYDVLRAQDYYGTDNVKGKYLPKSVNKIGSGKKIVQYGSRVPDGWLERMLSLQGIDAQQEQLTDLAVSKEANSIHKQAMEDLLKLHNIALADKSRIGVTIKEIINRSKDVRVKMQIIDGLEAAIISGIEDGNNQDQRLKDMTSDDLALLLTRLAKEKETLREKR